MASRLVALWGRTRSASRWASARSTAVLTKYAATLPLRSFRRFGAVAGIDRSMAIASRVFIALTPLGIVISSLFGGPNGFANWVVTRFKLGDTATLYMKQLFDRPDVPRSFIATAIGLLVVVFSALSFTRALQRTYEAAWGLPTVGIRGSLNGAIGIGALIVDLAAITLLARLVPDRWGLVVVVEIVKLAISCCLWLVIQFFLLDRRIGPVALLPGAIVCAFGERLAAIAVTLYLPHVLATNASRYGLIGITFSLISCLLVFALAMVAGAVVSAELGGAVTLPRRIAGVGHWLEARLPKRA